jgi:hypothetical protein
MKFSDVDESSADERSSKELSESEPISHRVIARIPTSNGTKGRPLSSDGSSPERGTRTNQMNRFQYSDEDAEPTPRSSPHERQLSTHYHPSSHQMGNMYMSPPHGSTGNRQTNMSYTDPSISASLSGGSDSSTPSRQRTNSDHEENLYSRSMALPAPDENQMIPRPHSISLVSSPSRPLPLTMTAKISPPPPVRSHRQNSSPDLYSPYSAANISPPYPIYSHDTTTSHQPHGEPDTLFPSPSHGNSSLVDSQLVTPDLSAFIAEDNGPQDDASATMNWPWVQYFTEEGWPYYYNQVTGESSWDYPEHSLRGENILDFDSTSGNWQTEEVIPSIEPPSPLPSHNQLQEQNQYEISDDSDLSSCTSVDIKTDTNSVFSRSAASTSGMIEQKNKQGQSVLHISASSGNIQALSLLVSLTSLSSLSLSHLSAFHRHRSEYSRW